MARRKRLLEDGDDSDSAGSSDADLDLDNPDVREERELFENPYRKRRRTNGKESATYGIFADDSDYEGFGKQGKSTTKRSDWTKAPSFVSGDKPVRLDEPMQVDSASDADQGEVSDVDGDSRISEGEDETREEAEYSDESEPSRAPSPRVQLEEEEDESEIQPSLGGIGSKHGIGHSSSSFPSFAGPSRGGIGSKTSDAVPSMTASGHSPSSRNSPTPDSMPSVFSSRSQSFTRDGQPSVKPVALPASQMAHFRKIQNTFGAKMLEKMGWKAGTGLGVSGEGIAVPIESKLRPQKMGIAFKGFQEKTEQSKLEARRRGEIISDDEDEKTRGMKKKVKEAEQKRSESWKRPKKVKTIIEHKTYEEILAEAGEQPPVSGIGQIIDARGPTLQEVSSLADISLNSWTPTGDPTRIPEVRHNVRLISDVCKSDLDGLAREARALQERRKFIIAEDSRLRQQVHSETELISRLQQIQMIAINIDATAKELSSLYEISLEPFEPHFQKLLNDYVSEFEKYNLDEIVVGAITPLVRRMATTWNPLEDPTFLLSTFRRWRTALRVSSSNSGVEMQIDKFGLASTSQLIDQEKPMTPFESLLWTVWLPRVRTALNNDWAPTDPLPAVKLYESWSSFLPTFIRDNILDQLILPKIQRGIADWNVKKSKVSLQAIVFPWLPYVGLRLEDVVGDARRKIKSILRAWVADEAIPNDLSSWKEVFDVRDWDSMLLKYVVPKLAAALRNDFRVNPRDQKMDVLQHVLVWFPLMRPSMFSQILEAEFFPKWLDILHIWLVQPRVSFEEVAQWYSFWKETFPEDVRNIPGVERGFTRGLQLMNKAIELGPEAPSKLAKPDFLAEISAASSTRIEKATKPLRPSSRSLEITFRSIVEEYAASHNLLFIPIGRAHERSRMPLYRVSRRADGKKGLLVYILDDAVWAPKADVANAEAEEFRAISLEDMVLRAS